MSHKAERVVTLGFFRALLNGSTCVDECDLVETGKTGRPQGPFGRFFPPAPAVTLRSICGLQA